MLTENQRQVLDWWVAKLTEETTAIGGLIDGHDRVLDKMPLLALLTSIKTREGYYARTREG